MDRENVNYHLDFLNKAYAMVNDPSTDSIISWSQNGKSFIVWNPEECSKNILTQVLGITNFARFETYGFRKIVPGQELEFAHDDFVRDQPELLEKICKRYVQTPLNEETEKEESRAAAIYAIDELRISLQKLKDHIKQVDDIQKLQSITNVLDKINNEISDLMKRIDLNGSNSSSQNVLLASL